MAHAYYYYQQGTAMKRSLDTTSALAICAALSGSAAHAQSSDAETLDTIIVTQSRIQEHVTKMGSASLETPQNIQVLSEGFLKDMGVSLLDDALRNVAGVSASSFVYAYDLPSIRGFPAGGFTLLDGLPRTVALNIEPQALERIEVIKGPTSALYGQGAPGGVINLVSKRPVKKAFADASLTVGSYDMMIPALDIGGSFNADQSVYGRLNALYRQEGTYVDYTDGVKRLFLGPSLTWEIGADTEITFISHYSQERNELIPDRPATGLLFPNPNGRLSPRQTIEDPNSPPQIDQRFTSIGYEFEHRFSDRLKVVQNVRQSWTELDYYNIYQPLFLGADQRTLYLYGNDLDESRRSLGIDTLLIGSFDMGSVRHRLAAGFEYGRQRVDSKPSYAFSPLVAFDLFAPDYSVFQRGDFALFPSLREDESRGLYLQDEIKLGRVTVTAGGRFDWVTVETAGSEEKHDAFVPRVGATYEIVPGLAGYASYSESFNPQVGMLDAEGHALDPESGEQYELGLKLLSPDGRYNVTTAIYEITRSNVASALPAPAGRYDTSGRQRSRGFEIDSQIQLRRGWEMIASYAYTDVEVLEDYVTPKGNWPVNVPRNAVSLWTKYVIQDGALRGLGFSVGGSRYTKMAGDPANTFFVPAYTLVNANISYVRDNGFNAQLNVDNVLDEFYAAGAFTDMFVNYGRPRTVRLTVGWSLW